MAPFGPRNWSVPVAIVRFDRLIAPPSITSRVVVLPTPDFRIVRLRPAASSEIAAAFEKTANPLSEFMTIVAFPLMTAVSAKPV
jgi:hypothetical protein